MFWKTLNLIVNCTFLLLAVTIMTILLKNEGYRQDFSSYEVAIADLRRDLNKVHQSNFVYLEEKINRVAGNQDSYQTNMSRRVDVLEVRQQVLEDRKRDSSRIINNNNAIANGQQPVK